MIVGPSLESEEGVGLRLGSGSTNETRFCDVGESADGEGAGVGALAEDPAVGDGALGG